MFELENEKGEAAGTAGESLGAPGGWEKENGVAEEPKPLNPENLLAGVVCM